MVAREASSVDRPALARLENDNAVRSAVASKGVVGPAVGSDGVYSGVAASRQDKQLATTLAAAFCGGWIT